MQNKYIIIQLPHILLIEQLHQPINTLILKAEKITETIVGMNKSLDLTCSAVFVQKILGLYPPDRDIHLAALPLLRMIPFPLLCQQPIRVSVQRRIWSTRKRTISWISSICVFLRQRTSRNE